MFDIRGYLSRLRKTLNDKKAEREVLSLVIEEVSGVIVPTSNIKSSGDKLIVKCRPALKTAIFLKKQEILARFKERGLFFREIL